MTSRSLKSRCGIGWILLNPYRFSCHKQCTRPRSLLFPLALTELPQPVSPILIPPEALRDFDNCLSPPVRKSCCLGQSIQNLPLQLRKRDGSLPCLLVVG